ncbi:MAG: hypothetical protein NZM65_07085 [Flavobacteriales bacterium]|nr:hypothetical protein [Flavobacteriales bacterium]MDW8410437.1 hypothetical protein [Flavobacteriales bacterium]
MEGLRVNGQRWNHPWIGPEIFAFGGVVEFQLGSKPVSPSERANVRSIHGPP